MRSSRSLICFSSSRIVRTTFLSADIAAAGELIAGILTRRNRVAETSLVGLSTSPELGCCSCFVWFRSPLSDRPGGGKIAWVAWTPQHRVTEDQPNSGRVSIRKLQQDNGKIGVGMFRESHNTTKW